MRRRRVEVVIELLHVLAVIALRAGQTEESLLQNRIFAVPECEREAKPALSIRNTKQAVFAPAIRAAPRVIVRKIVPAISARRIIFANRRPLSFREVRTQRFQLRSREASSARRFSSTVSPRRLFGSMLS